MNLSRASPQTYFETFSPTMLCGIAQGFLENSEQRKRNSWWQTSRDIVTMEINFHLVALTKLPAEILCRSNDAQVIQFRRVQFVR